jgi:hypothetical protein
VGERTDVLGTLAPTHMVEQGREGSGRGNEEGEQGRLELTSFKRLPPVGQRKWKEEKMRQQT